METPVKNGTPDAEAPARIVSMDQFRGYAIFGMIMVNYLGNFGVMPETFRHHDHGMSYADLIAPLFIFVAGMGFRLSFLRRLEKDGAVRTALAALRRFSVLILVGIVLYGPAPENWRNWWDALVDIGFAGILALPVIARGAGVRAGLAAVWLALYQALHTLTGYGAWTMTHSIDGGPLGILPWAAIFLFGTIAHDIASSGDTRRLLPKIALWGLALCAAGWLLKFEWPGVKAEWPFTQRGMTAPYPLYAAGLCFLSYLPFYLLCDVGGWRIPHLSVLGMNPLVIYIVQQALGDMHGTIIPESSGPAAALAGFAGFYLICYAVAWKLHRDRIIIKL
ncbi:MAG: DUF1624 domain-containing protein [Candidatus Hydrogenedens sp.]|nr:DUF1624 domain-containing protein [Candidatus Hydrogenedens sp.]